MKYFYLTINLLDPFNAKDSHLINLRQSYQINKSPTNYNFIKTYLQSTANIFLCNYDVCQLRYIHRYCHKQLKIILKQLEEKLKSNIKIRSAFDDGRSLKLYTVLRWMVQFTPTPPLCSG